jgi:hypothetical protein
VGTTLKKAEVILPKEWNESISKAVRKVILFDAERSKLFQFMEQKGIWYLPLKGVILKDYYPGIGMRQMSDNDILFDCTYCDEVQKYMVSQGYKATIGHGNHDVYEKEPVYNFELHRSLYGQEHQEGWKEYYENVKDKLILNSGASYGYHFSDEDFYVYIVSHAYKHYADGGTGLRTLIDFYVYLNKKPELDFEYVEKECEALGIREFEQKSRKLCLKIFSEAISNGMKAFEDSLSAEENEMLLYYLSSGVYGTLDRSVEHRFKKFEEKESKSKFRYFMRRVFGDMKFYETYFPFFYKHKILLPVCFFYRIFRMLFSKERRNKMMREIEVVKKVK